MVLSRIAIWITKKSLIVYVSALGNIISGHYYMNDVSDTEAEIDDPFKLDTLVNKLYTEAHAVAYVDAIRTVITQQAKYADDARITRTVEQFCIHVYKWSANKNWYIFRWSIGVVMPYAINLLLSHGKIDPADILLDSYVQIVESYISKQYSRNELIIHHFSQGIGKLTRSNRISDEQRKRFVKRVFKLICSHGGRPPIPGDLPLIS